MYANPLQAGCKVQAGPVESRSSQMVMPSAFVPVLHPVAFDCCVPQSPGTPSQEMLQSLQEGHSGRPSGFLGYVCLQLSQT